MTRLFGTDGVRGEANSVITAEFSLALAVAASEVLAGGKRDRRPTALLARDPRASGEFISAAIAAGIASTGVDVVDLGVVPTPAVAHLTATMGVDFGVMVSASHNPMPDNGIKFFDSNGHKLTDEVEDEIEKRISQPRHRPVGADVGRITSEPHVVGSYLDHLVATAPHRLDGLKIVVDCAHGAASAIGPAALRSAGAEVILLAAEPDGLNINDGVGSTHLGPLQAAVVEHQADAGVAFDGDADRCLAVDENGEIVDGDKILGILAVAFKAQGNLSDNTLVATTMSNLGLLRAMEEAGINVVTTDVGDRYVLAEMVRHGFNLGGEQSGHVLFTDFSTTGDGVLTALQLLGNLAASQTPLSKLGAHVPKMPQVMINVPNVEKAKAYTDSGLLGAVLSAEESLGNTGRILLRPSGTEELVRVMVEAEDLETAQHWAETLAQEVRERLGN